MLVAFLLFNSNSAKAIMNGMEANKYANGVVALSSLPSYESAYCSGAYLQPYIVVTAAHCVVDDAGNPLKEIYVSFPGAILNEKTAWTEVSKVFYVLGWRNISQYVEQDDIAFITVRKDFGQAIFVDYANLEQLKEVRMGDQYVWHLGYGIKQYGGKMSSTPQLLGLMPHNGGVSSLNYDSFIRTTGSSSQSTCPGDSGGPTFSVIRGNVMLLGVLTGGNGCTQKFQKEYLTTSFSIQHYKQLLQNAKMSMNFIPQIPKDLEVILTEGNLKLTWTYPRTQDDQALTKFEVFNNGKIVCSPAYSRNNPFFSCITEAISGQNELNFITHGMAGPQNSKKLIVQVPESESRAGLLAAKAQADANAKAAAEAAAKAQADANAKAATIEAKKPTIKKITCVKGKITKVISGTNPKCPTGYKPK